MSGKKCYKYATPMGEMWICATQSGITDVSLKGQPRDAQIEENALTRLAHEQLMEYFAGRRTEFDLPLEMHGTEFQKSVWRALQEIPYGQTRSYKQVAQMVGSPKACRAVGMANNRNPFIVVVPCHRVIGANGSMVGYAVGVRHKEFLLNIEKQEEKPLGICAT